MTWKILITSLVLSVGLVSQSSAFELLNQLLGLRGSGCDAKCCDTPEVILGYDNSCGCDDPATCGCDSSFDVGRCPNLIGPRLLCKSSFGSATKSRGSNHGCSGCDQADCGCDRGTVGCDKKTACSITPKACSHRCLKLTIPRITLTKIAVTWPRPCFTFTKIEGCRKSSGCDGGGATCASKGCGCMAATGKTSVPRELPQPNPTNETELTPPTPEPDVVAPPVPAPAISVPPVPITDPTEANLMLD